jgi:putative aldouronate transport system permease protein
MRSGGRKERDMKQKRRLMVDVARDWQLYVFLAAPLAFILIFHYYPILGLQIAFKSYSGRLGIWGSPWIGFANFAKFFSSYYFWRVLTNTLLLSLYTIAVSFPLPIVLALIINSIRSKRIGNIAQTIATLPHFISVVVLVGIMLQLFNSRNGLYGNIMMALNGSYPPDPFQSPANFRYFYLWSDVWQNAGWNSIVYIAALSGVDETIHESAMIDGATRFQRVLHIDIPSILPTIVIMLILRTGSVMTIGFEKVFLMQNGVNLSTSEVISTYIYKVGLSASGNTDFSYATAIGFFNSIST